MYALAFGSTVWEFAIRPESLEVTYPARINATPTLTAAYLDHFGPGIGAISIAGTTGWGKRHGLKNGITELKKLIQLYGNYLYAAAAADDPTSVRMTFADGYTKSSFLVAPDSSGLRTQQSKGSPMLVRFALTLIILKDLTGGRVAADQVTVGLIRTGLGAAISGALGVYQDLAKSYLGASPVLSPAVQKYTVQNGDTFDGIAQTYGVDATELGRVNGVRYPNRVLPGTVLTIPSSTNTFGSGPR